MSTRINPPTFLKSKNYERYRQELIAWREITDLSKEKQGIAIALSLPEEDETQIRQKVFDQIPIDDLKSIDGLTVLINFFDEHLAKDDLTDSLEKFEDFDDFYRHEGQSIQEFIAEYDAKYRKIEKKKMTLPPEILAFKLLRKACITKEEKLLVLTGMNYENKKTLYEEAKKSLKKFKGDSQAGSSSGAIRVEPTFLSANEEALLASGYTKGMGRHKPTGGERDETWKNWRSAKSSSRTREYQRTGTRRQTGREGYQRTESGSRVSQPSVRDRKNINPTGPDGRTLTCKSCGSYRHLLPACPDSWENMAKINLAEEEHAVLFTGYNNEEVLRLGIDAQNCAVLDSACSSTVCGDKWIKNYIQSLDPSDKNKIKRIDGQRVFKFGGGTCLKSTGEYSLPAVIAGNDVTIKTDVVESDIPLLLSRTAMKKAAIKMDLENDTANIMGKEVALNLTTSGHYCIPIDKTEEVPVENVCTIKLENLNKQERYKTLLKLHRQFAHPTKKRLIALLKDAGVWQEEYEDTMTQIEQECELCKVYAKTPSRPVVGLPMATKFNEKVAMDLKQWNSRWILHIIDMWSRYTVSIFIDRKQPSNVIDALMTHWIGRFGVMGALMTDNGGEFNSNEMREVASILNVTLCTTSGESPFQNGLCEKVHAITDMMLIKLEAEYGKMNSQTLLSWANMARNSLQMWNGYSSHQLVFGENPNLPNIMSDNLPAMEGTTSSEVFAKHLNALHAARKIFIESEANERIRRALRHKVRASEQVFENGDRVFYKREGKERWLGPGKVVFQDGKVVFVRHGGVFVRVSPNRLQKVNNYLKRDEEETGGDIEQGLPDKDSEKEEDKGTETSISEEIPREEPELGTDNTANTQQSRKALKANDQIQYKLQDTNDWIRATVTGRAGKATGRNRNWYNIKEDNSGEQKSINLDEIQWEQITDNVNVNITLKNDKDCSESTAAKLSELQKLRDFNTYEEVKNCGQHTLSTRWVITQKNGQVKARLVVRGFEEEFMMPRDSPTVGKGTMRTFLAIASSENWRVKTTDIKSAFLQGRELRRDVYIKPPKECGIDNSIVWKLKHGLYGLKDGARQFYLSVKEELLKLGCKMCEIDPAMFYLHRNDKLCGIVCCHVDDFLHAGDEYFEKMMKTLRKRFVAGKIEEKNFKYIGFRITQDNDGIVLDQSEYVENIANKTIDPKQALNKQSPLTADEQTEYRQLIGQMNWAVQGTRPDMAFELIDLSTKLKQGNVSDMARAIKVINRLKDIRSINSFPNLSSKTSDWKIVVFTDASLCNINDGTGSTAGYIVWLVDHQGKCCPLSWHAGKIKRVVRSTIAAETLSLQEGLECSFYYRKMIEDIFGISNKTVPIVAYVDNKSVIEAVYSTKLVDDKRLRVDIAAISESLERNEIQEIKWCPGKIHLADCLTKRGAAGYNLLHVLETGRLPEDFV